MPVVNINLARFCRMVGADRRRIMDRLPYVGLDIEGEDAKSVRVEYSPNRPDFGTDYGIARALRGTMGKELGPPRYKSRPSGMTVAVDPRLAGVRPYIACVAATGLKLDDEDVRQLISLQEDLHNGLGRKRRRVAIGLHDMTAVTPPISYAAHRPGFRFRPLDCGKEMSLSEILADTEQGRQYGTTFKGTKLYPVITDAIGVVLSFPPIINGDATKVSTKTHNLFVDVTSTEVQAGDHVLSILATTLADMGAKLGSVRVSYGKSVRTTPDLRPSKVPLDMKLIDEVLGLGLSRSQVVESLRRSRLGVERNTVMVPGYRFDIIHPVDIAEEVALGYGFDRLSPLYPESRQPGAFNPLSQFLERTADIMAGSGMVELMNYELVDERTLYAGFGRTGESRIQVENPRSSEHSILRDSLVPSLMAALARNVKDEYPQRVFEIGRVYLRERGKVSEEWRLCCLIAHSQASYTEAKMHLESVVRLMAGREAATRPSTHWAFAPGRCAAAQIGGAAIGHVGEVTPEAVSAFQIGVPVSGFELRLGPVFEQL
ncbi:MAG: phenylalanine--tRNA ligase subunit beta, partial [Nitrososphaerota archaeon]|nr:phenylalanine--tRNA ligase subunit beta [Nitrososphaerota archaeon]